MDGDAASGGTIPAQPGLPAIVMQLSYGHSRPQVLTGGYAFVKVVKKTCNIDHPYEATVPRRHPARRLQRHGAERGGAAAAATADPGLPGHSALDRRGAGALGSEDTGHPGDHRVSRTVAANTPAVVIPGRRLLRAASNHEGRQVASYLTPLGVAAFVLRYRLGPRYHHPIEPATRSARSVTCALRRSGGSIPRASASSGSLRAAISR